MKKYILAGIFLSLAVSCDLPSVSFYSGAWYNPNGIIYIVNPLEDKTCEIAEIIIDNMFKVTQEPEIGIVHERAYIDDEIINFNDRNVKVCDVIYYPTSGARPIDIFDIFINPYLSDSEKIEDKIDKIVIPKNNDILVRRIYIEDKIEIIKEGNTNEYFELINKLNGSRLVVFRNSENSNKYIFNDMELIDYGERFGKGDQIGEQIIVELYNENEAVMKWECFSDRVTIPGHYTIKIYYKIHYINSETYFAERIIEEIQINNDIENVDSSNINISKDNKNIHMPLIIIVMVAIIVVLFAYSLILNIRS